MVITTFQVTFIIRSVAIFFMTLANAISSLKRGEFVLLHDAGTRENEVDMILAAQFVTPAHIARMRQHAGGLVCVAIDNAFAKRLDLCYMHDILSHTDDFDAESKNMIIGTAPYGDRPSFSISINHVQTYTGVTDRDRALTVKQLANLHNEAPEDQKQKFVSSFNTPGHTHMLIASNGLLSRRLGHTEMSVYLMQLTKLTPVALICEMLDSETYTALSVKKAKSYAQENAIAFLDGNELLEFSKVH